MGVQPFVDWPKHPNHLRAAYIARILGLSPEAVKARIRKLERAGHIQGYEAYPNLGHLDLTLWQFIFRSKARSEHVARRVATVDGVGATEFMLGGRVGVEILGRSEPEVRRRAALVGALLGDVQPMAMFRYPHPPIQRDLTHLDWRILRALRGRATRSLDDVARELKVSGKTVKRRFQAMWKEGSLDTFALLTSGSEAQVLFCGLLLTLRPDADPPKLKDLTREFEDQWCYCFAPPAPQGRQLVVGLLARNVAEIDSSVERARGLRIVEDAEAVLSTRVVYAQAWLDQAIDEQIARTGPVSKTRRRTR